MNNEAAVIVALVVVLIIGIVLRYRNYLKMKLKVPGVEVDLTAKNDTSTVATDRSPEAQADVSGNRFVGKTEVEVKGRGAVTDNITLGDTRITIDETRSAASPESPKTRSRGKRK